MHEIVADMKYLNLVNKKSTKKSRRYAVVFCLAAMIACVFNSTCIVASGLGRLEFPVEIWQFTPIADKKVSAGVTAFTMSLVGTWIMLSTGMIACYAFLGLFGFMELKGYITTVKKIDSEHVRQCYLTLLNYVDHLNNHWSFWQISYNGAFVLSTCSGGFVAMKTNDTSERLTSVLWCLMALMVYLCGAIPSILLNEAGDKCFQSLLRCRELDVKGRPTSWSTVIKHMENNSTFMTAGNVFVLKRESLLTALSFIVTYLVLFVQFSMTDAESGCSPANMTL